MRTGGVVAVFARAGGAGAHAEGTVYPRMYEAALRCDINQLPQGRLLVRATVMVILIRFCPDNKGT